MRDPHAGPGTSGGPAHVGPPEVLVVDLGPGVRAGFTTRSAGPAGADGADGADVADDSADHHMNLGLGVGDDPERVRARRRRVADWAGGPVAWVTQVHGTDVVVLDGVARDVEPVGEADALVAPVGQGVAVVVADCVPVLLADPGAGVVAAVHAGRRGLADGVLQRTVDAMVDRGAHAADVHAAIGPSICGACYEVPADLRDAVAAVVPDVAARTSWGTPALDLPAGAAAVLHGRGVGVVHRVGVCTDTDHRFFSHRRAVRTGETPGRFAGVVRIGAGGSGVS